MSLPTIRKQSDPFVFTQTNTFPGTPPTFPNEPSGFPGTPPIIDEQPTNEIRDLTFFDLFEDGRARKNQEFTQTQTTEQTGGSSEPTRLDTVTVTADPIRSGGILLFALGFVFVASQ